MTLARFLESSPYTRPADRKKLRFIHANLEEYARTVGKPLRELTVLEPGCADGGITLALASLGGPIRSFDVDREAVEALEQRLSARGIENVTVTEDDALSFDDGHAYDVIVAAEVISNVPDPKRFLHTMARRLTSEGLLLLTTPNAYGPYVLSQRVVNPVAWLKHSNRLRALLGRRPYERGEGGRAQYYSRAQFLRRQQLEGILAELGLRIVDTGHSDAVLASLGSVYARSQRLGELDVRLADRVPYWLASGWFIAARGTARPEATPTDEDTLLAGVPPHGAPPRS